MYTLQAYMNETQQYTQFFVGFEEIEFFYFNGR